MTTAAAIYEGRRILATADGPAVAACPGCASPMRAKRGTVVVHHWAHLPDPDRQCVSEGETEWHLGWKNRAGDPDRIEVAVGNRRADVLTPYGWAIEFQHSPLSPPDIAARERDWRDRMLWVYDGLEAFAEERLEINQPPGRAYWSFKWRWHKRHVAASKVPTFIQVKPDTLLFVGRWYPKSPGDPLRGYGWRLTDDDFEQHVMNGTKPPVPPKFGRDLAPAMWSRTPSIPFTCPCCDQPFTEPGKCSAALWHVNGPNYQAAS